MGQDNKTGARRKARVRRAVKARAYGKPRLSVHRSSKQIYCQIIDDAAGRTLASASTLEKANREGLKTGATIEAARHVGKQIADRATGGGHQGRRIRPRLLYVSRPRQGAGRGRTRGRVDDLSMIPKSCRLFGKIMRRKSIRSERPTGRASDERDGRDYGT